ncbi:MAG: response regulator [Tannerella sp.]|jgi:signal transduction histidine kinase/ligand-binding sensor domain-containing protein/AraC-like DNA-binding protein|nr:response regulator [Tannerella sp.]
MKRIIFTLFIVFSASQFAHPIYFKQIGVKDGLAQTSVMSIYQDELGRMWFGTEEGLSVYDGKDLISFKHSEDSIISQNMPIGNSTFPIVGDKNGNIYFRSDTKLIHYDVREERFSCLKNENVSTVFCKDSLVLVASSDTIYRWDNKSRTFSLFAKTNIPGNNIQKIFFDSKNRLWAGNQYGLFLYADNNKLQHFINNVFIYEITEDSQSNLWIATRDEGMYKYSRDSILTIIRHEPDNPNSIPHNQIRSFTEDNYGNIWIGTFNGLCKYNAATDKYITYRKDDIPGALNHSSVFSTYKDKQGSIWVGTYYGGVHYFNPETDCFSYYSADIRRDDCLSYFFVGKMAEDKDGNLWICTEGGGLNFFDRKTKTFRHYTADQNKHSISHNNLKSITYSEKYNKLYIGTHTGGLSIYDISKGFFHNFRDEKPNYHKQIGDVIINTKLYKEDWLIIQSRNGLFRLNLYTEELSPLFSESNRVYGALFFIDSDDYLWLANSADITRINMNNDSESLVLNKKETGFGNFGVSCIFEDSKGRLFFGTSGSGIYQYDKDSSHFISYTAERNQLQSNYCYEIAESEQNELIVSGDKGLSFLNLDRNTLRIIDLNALLFSGINYGCGLLVCSNGEVFAGGIGGMTSFFDQEVFSINKDYNLYFSSLSVNDEKILPNDKTKILEQTLPYTRKITLTHKQNNLNIAFTSNNYINVYTKNQFEYKLEGFDEKWISGNHIIYTNLEPGKYKLLVREKIPEYKTISKMIVMDISVRYAWYANPIAYTVYFIIAYLILLTFLRFKRVRQRLRTSLDTERKEKEQIAQLNHAKLQFFSNISHEFHTPLTLIIVQIERLLNSSSISPFVYNKLLKVNKQAVHLRNLISELLDFRKLEQGHIKLKVRELNIIPFLKEIYISFHELSSERNITYTFETSGTEYICCWFDPKQLQKVFYNLISNAFKYTKPNGSIELSIQENDDAIIIKVIDSGIGISKNDIQKIFDRFYQADNSGYNLQNSPSTGIGLSVVKGILDLHHGSISVESKPSYGSIFITSMRKGNSHFSPSEIIEDETDGDILQKRGIEPETTPIESIQKNKQDMPEEGRNAAFINIPVNKTDAVSNQQTDETEADEEKHTVLLVEDNDELLQILEDILSPAYRVLLAHNGKDGLDMVRREKPDLIISDIMMPEMSGTELCVAVKNDFETCHIPVILLTALSSVEQSIYGLQHGADDYITKPFNEKTLTIRCNNLIRNRLIIQNKFSRNVDFDIQFISNNPIDQKFLDTINRIIENNFDNPVFNINALAGELNVSRSSLYSKFEALTGMTPNDYVLQRKLKKASDMLRNNPDSNISEISDILGFGSPRYFSRCFKNQFGISPAEYRKKHHQ